MPAPFVYCVLCEKKYCICQPPKEKAQPKITLEMAKLAAKRANEDQRKMMGKAQPGLEDLVEASVNSWISIADNGDEVLDEEDIFNLKKHLVKNFKQFITELLQEKDQVIDKLIEDRPFDLKDARHQLLEEIMGEMPRERITSECKTITSHISPKENYKDGFNKALAEVKEVLKSLAP